MTWTKVVDQQPSFTSNQAAEGLIVIVVGESWNQSDARWPWTLVSLDGGRTWDRELSWSGVDGGCLGQVVTGAGMAVMVGCEEAQPAIWTTRLPAVASEPSGIVPPRPDPDAPSARPCATP